MTVVADRDRPAASKAALCVVRPQWFNGSQRADAVAAVDWYRSLGAVTAVTARWGSYRTPGQWRDRDSFFAINPDAVLVEPDIVDPLDLDLLGYDATALCRGAGTDLEWTRSWGATTIVRGVFDLGLRVEPIIGYEHRPYHSTYVVTHNEGATYRLGSSVAADPDRAVERQIEHETRLTDLGIAPVGYASRVIGCRVMPPNGFQPGEVRRLDPRTWAIEGFGRVGFSLAPARTYEAIIAMENALL